MTRVARCCCGLCSIEVTGEPVVNGICHCNNCKRRTGSAFGWSAYFPDDRIVRREGELKIYAIDGAKRQDRWFCARCGTTLLWKAAALANLTGIAGGCFVDIPLAEPTATVSNEGRCAWLSLPAGWDTSVSFTSSSPARSPPR
jgi:hypothetical protein